MGIWGGISGWNLTLATWVGVMHSPAHILLQCTRKYPVMDPIKALKETSNLGFPTL